MEYEKELRESGKYTEIVIQEKMLKRNSIYKILNSNDYDKLFKLPLTQSDFYKSKGAHDKIINLSMLGNKTYGARQEQLSRIQFNMEKNKSSAWDHNKLEKKIEQKSIRYSCKGCFGQYMHIEPAHKWDYLLLVKLDINEWISYIIKRSSIEYFIESKQKFIRVQGNGDSYQGYLLNENIPEEIKNKYYTLIEDENDLINFIKNDN